jgi:hypothetical protein
VKRIDPNGADYRLRSIVRSKAEATEQADD